MAVETKIYQTQIEISKVYAENKMNQTPLDLLSLTPVKGNVKICLIFTLKLHKIDSIHHHSPRLKIRKLKLNPVQSSYVNILKQ